MLFLLTGDVQTGKTRWLEALVDELEKAGVHCEGVLAPGVWVEHAADPAEREVGGRKHRETGAAEGASASCEGPLPRYEKIGIENLLFPQRTRIDFARRRDLALIEGKLDESSESSRAGLGWEISDRALQQVNEHFEGLMRASLTARRSGAQACGRLLSVVDELGRLELLHGGGLTFALEYLKCGPVHEGHHAIVVVREALCGHADNTLAGVWGRPHLLAPDERARKELIRLFAAYEKFGR